MSLRDYFEQGRKQEQDYSRKMRARQVYRKQGKLSKFSPAMIVVGAGVLYEMIAPKLAPLFNRIKMPGVGVGSGVLSPIAKTIRYDIARIVAPFKKRDRDFADYERFLELARK
jgi:hypothetical protein